MTPLLELSHLAVAVHGTAVVHDVSLTIQPGELHVIMGPNGSGKSTLAAGLAGQPGYDVTAGSARYAGDDLLTWSADERARRGLFLAFQYPVEIPGLTMAEFLRAAQNAVREARGEPTLDPLDFLNAAAPALSTLNLSNEWLARSVNEGFSGGEKKRSEVLQLLLLQPRLAILDETDSGLDVDALRMVCSALTTQRSSERGFLVVTHYARLLSYLTPDYVHLMVGGKLVRSGDQTLAETIERDGFAAIMP